jgi:Protein of unknown function (DUF3048) N-terminal domain/Protein of unknown function (DUF3048) C-terminal domain
MLLRTRVGVGLTLVSCLATFAACSPSEPTASPASSPIVAGVTPSPSAWPSSSASASPTPTLTAVASDPAAGTLGPDADYAALDGIRSQPGVRDRLPVAVMVDDSLAARPQYGFNSASIVYQAPADGGEDRYMFVYQEVQARRIEPVRSGRPYFVNWASEYRAAFAHYGGDAKTLLYLPTLDGKVIYDIDAIYGSAKAFDRDHKRVAPHNGVTSTVAVRRLAVRRGAPARVAPSLEVRPYTDDLPASERPGEGAIRVPYNRGATSYTYDKPSNSYLRSVAGKAQFDKADGKRVTARNVVVLWMHLSVDPESEPHHHRPLLDHIGKGTALVFHDGHVIRGTWRKASASGLTRFFDESGNEIPLVRGRIFIQVVATPTKVTYKAAS